MKTKMKKLLILLSLILFNSCLDSKNTGNLKKEKKEESILPFEIELRGVIREIKDVQNSTPLIKMLIKKDSIAITVGKTEKYFIQFDSTEFVSLLPHLKLQDFRSNNYYFNPYLPHGGYVKLFKEINGETFSRTITNFKRKDIEIEYIELDSLEISKSYHLARIANNVAIPLIKDSVKKDTMLVAKSMKEALQNPEKVYELHLRNTRTKYLSPNIKKLKNLRVLDISGSFITEIPKEIEECVNLKIIKANASKLSKIPTTIGNLKKLRVLNFGYCKIKSIPDEIGNLTTLWSLGLGSNQLEEIPESISNLKNVTFFSIAKNNFKEFPNSILEMESVGNLWIHGNKIEKIPLEISKMPSLHHFLLSQELIENLEEIRKIIPEVRVVDQK